MMSLGEILSIYRARLRTRMLLVQEALAVLGIAVGVALLFASQVASTSLDSSVRELTRQVVGSTQLQLDSRGPDGFREQLVTRAEHLPGVRLAMPLLEQQATIIGPRGKASVDLVGADPRFAHTGGQLLRRFSARQIEHQQAIALPAPLAAAIGVRSLEPVHLQIGATVTNSFLGVTLQKADIGGLINSQIALAPVAYAQKLAGMPGRVTRIFIQIWPGQQAQVHAALKVLADREHLDLAPAGFDARLFAVAAAPAQKGEQLFSAISAIVGFLFAFNAMLLTVPERRKLIEGMRRRGTTRSMTVQMLAFDALVIGALACAIGLALGDVLSVRVFHTQPGYLAYAFPVGADRIVTLQTVVLAVGAGMLAAFIGVLAPVRVILARPLRSTAAAELTPRGWTSLRVAAGVLCFAITTLILIFRPQAAVAGSFTLIITVLCLLPFLFQGIVSALAALQRPFGTAAAKLALSELQDPITRVHSLAVAATGAIAVFGSVAILGAQQNLQSGLDRTAREWNSVTDLWVSPSGVDNTLATTPFPVAAGASLARLPRVAAVSVYRGSFLNVGDRRIWVIAPPRSSPQPIPSGQLTKGNPATAAARLQDHGWAIVSEAIAHELHLGVGGQIALPSPVPTRFRIAGLSTNSGWPPGAVVINADDYARAWGTTAASAFNISLRSGTSPARGRREVELALGPSSGLAVQTAAERAHEWRTVSRQGLARLTQIGTLVLIAAILAMAGVMSSMIWQRRERIAYIKRQGFTRGLLWRALFCESAILLGSGCSIGAVFGLYGQLLISDALATVTGFPIAISAGAFIAIASFAIVGAAALAIVAIPGYLAVRVRATTVSPA